MGVMRRAGGRVVGAWIVTALTLTEALVACSSGSDQSSSGQGGNTSSQTSTSGHASSSGSATGGHAASSTTGGGGSATGGGGDAGPPAMGITKVATGEYETFYLKDGIVYGYGGVTGNLGLGSSFTGIAIPPVKIVTPAGLKFLDVQAGLHQSMALDENHHVWTWGVASQSGAPDANDPDAGIDVSTPYMIAVDDKGNPFDKVVAIEPTTNFDMALKGDGTVWVWGDCSGGITGDGTMGGKVNAPTQVPIPLPAGVKITKIAGASAILALASDGSVWAWGFAEGGVLGTGNTADGTVPRKVLGLPVDIVDITAGGSDWFIALTSAGEIYGWGYRNPYLGIQGYNPVMTPISLNSMLQLQKPVKSVVADSLTTHVILTDGTLWGWGDAAQGTLGDGEEPDWTKSGCGWNAMSYDMMVYTPKHVAPGVSNFATIFANSAYDFYVYAQTTDGVLYSWGRNKTGTLGNGVVAAAPNGNSGSAAQIAAAYPNSWDVPTATIVTPFTTPLTPVLSPCCTSYDDAGACQ